MTHRWVSASAGCPRITVTGDPELARGAVRAWIAQAVTWHDAGVLGVALAAPGLDTPAWSWLKWLPRGCSGGVDGVGPARYPTASPDDLIARIGPVLADRPSFGGDAAPELRHLLIIVDDPGWGTATWITPCSPPDSPASPSCTSPMRNPAAMTTRIPNARSFGWAIRASGAG